MNWYLLALAYLGLFALGLADNARGPVFPDLLAEFKLTDTVGSMFFFVASASGLLINLVSHIWLERLGLVRAMAVFTALLLVSLAGFGVAHGYGEVLFFGAVFGLSAGGLGVVVNLMACEAVPREKRRQALSGLHCMYGIASLSVPGVVTFLYQIGFQWRGVFASLALVPGLALIGLSAYFARAPGQPSIASPQAKPLSDLAAGRPWRRTLAFAAMVGLYVVAEIAVSSRLVLYARREIGLSIESSNALLSLFFLLLFVGRFAAALVHVPWRNRTILKVSALSSGACFSLGLLHSPLWLALCGLTMSIFYPSAIALVHEEMGEDSGFVTAWCVAFQSFGLMAMHFSLGALSDLVGLGPALWMGPLCLILALGFLRR